MVLPAQSQKNLKKERTWVKWLLDNWLAYGQQTSQTVDPPSPSTSPQDQTVLSRTILVKIEELNLASEWERQENTQEHGDQKEYWKLLMSRRWNVLLNNTSYVYLLLPNLRVATVYLSQKQSNSFCKIINGGPWQADTIQRVRSIQNQGKHLSGPTTWAPSSAIKEESVYGKQKKILE